MAITLGRPGSVLSDAVGPLIEFYEVVRDYPGELAWTVSGLAARGIDKDAYYSVRDMPLDGLSKLARAARFFYLARLAYNGLYRENKKGEFNVPYGDAVYRPSIVGRSSRDAIESLFPNKEKIHKVSEALADCHIWLADFEHSVNQAGQGDLVYADPPYDGTYNGYAAGGFGDGDQERLAAALYKATQRGANIVAHNSLTDRVQYLYGEWCYATIVKEKRSVAADGDKRQRVPCVVMTNNAELAGKLGWEG